MGLLTANTLTANLIGPPRRVIENGKEFLVVPAVLINPGVLPGSKGALAYTPEDTRAATKSWNRVPLTARHPFDPLTNEHLSANAPGVWERQGIGDIRQAEFSGKLRSEAWVEVARANKVDNRIVPTLEAGQPIELSTGLFTENEDAPANAHMAGRPFTAYARNHEPDHVAVLMDERGACSLQDGCGLLVNAWHPTTNANPKDKPVVCTCLNWPRIKLRNGSTHEPDCPVHKSWQAVGGFQNKNKHRRSDGLWAANVLSSSQEQGRAGPKDDCGDWGTRKAAGLAANHGDENDCSCGGSCKQCKEQAEGLIGSKVTGVQGKETTVTELAGNEQRRVTNASLAALEAADFVRLPKGISGTNCGNCEYQKKGNCTHPKLTPLPVTPQDCCAYWNAEGTKRPRGELATNKLQATINFLRRLDQLWVINAKEPLTGGRWVTTEDGNHLYIKDGKPIAGNPHVVAAAQGQAREEGAKPEQTATQLDHGLDPAQFKKRQDYADAVQRRITELILASGKNQYQAREQLKEQKRKEGELSDYLKDETPEYTKKFLSEEGQDERLKAEAYSRATHEWREFKGLSDITPGTKLSAKELEQHLESNPAVPTAFQIESKKVLDRLSQEDRHLIDDYVMRDQKPEGKIAEALDRAVAANQPLPHDITSARGLRLSSEQINQLVEALQKSKEAVLPLDGPRSFSDSPDVALDFAKGGKSGYRVAKGDAGAVLHVLIPKGTKVATMASGLNMGWEHVVSSGHQLRILKSVQKGGKSTRAHTAFYAILEPVVTKNQLVQNKKVKRSWHRLVSAEQPRIVETEVTANDWSDAARAAALLARQASAAARKASNAAKSPQGVGLGRRPIGQDYGRKALAKAGLAIETAQAGLGKSHPLGADSHHRGAAALHQSAAREHEVAADSAHKQGHVAIGMLHSQAAQAHHRAASLHLQASGQVSNKQRTTVNFLTNLDALFVLNCGGKGSGRPGPCPGGSHNAHVVARAHAAAAAHRLAEAARKHSRLGTAATEQGLKAAHDDYVGKMRASLQADAERRKTGHLQPVAQPMRSASRVTKAPAAAAQQGATGSGKPASGLSAAERIKNVERVHDDFVGSLVQRHLAEHGWTDVNGKDVHKMVSDRALAGTSRPGDRALQQHMNNDVLEKLREPDAHTDAWLKRTLPQVADAHAATAEGRGLLKPHEVAGLARKRKDYALNAESGKQQATTNFLHRLDQLWVTNRRMATHNRHGRRVFA